MTTYVVLLRAVNLGSTNKVAMADLRVVLEAAGGRDVRTFLQSGNAVMASSLRSTAAVEKAVAARLRQDLALDVAVLVRTAAELDAVVAAAPYGDRDPKRRHVAFLSAEPAAAKVRALDPAKYLPVEYTFGDRVAYLHLPEGFQGARLPDWDKLLGVRATVRTWNTVTRLSHLAGRTDTTATGS